MHIREAAGRDRDTIHNIHFSAFPEEEREIVSKLAVDLLSETTTPATFSLIAEEDGAVVGHVAFSPVSIDQHPHIHGYNLAPLAVLPAHQTCGIGSRLVENGIGRLSGTDTDILFVYGDPKYYGRFGFRADVAARYVPPYRLQYPFGWLGLMLRDFDIEKESVGLTFVSSLNNQAYW